MTRDCTGGLPDRTRPPDVRDNVTTNDATRVGSLAGEWLGYAVAIARRHFPRLSLDEQVSLAGIVCCELAAEHDPARGPFRSQLSRLGPLRMRSHYVAQCRWTSVTGVAVRPVGLEEACTDRPSGAATDDVEALVAIEQMAPALPERLRLVFCDLVNDVPAEATARFLGVDASRVSQLRDQVRRRVSRLLRSSRSGRSSGATTPSGQGSPPTGTPGRDPSAGSDRTPGTPRRGRTAPDGPPPPPRR